MGRRNVGRPRKRWRDDYILRIKEQETRLNLHEHDDDDDEHFSQTVDKIQVSLNPAKNDGMLHGDQYAFMTICRLE